MDANTFDTTSLVSQGAAITVVSTMSGQVTNLLLQMLPFCYVAIPLITLDLYYGRKKAQYRYEHKLSNIPCTIQRSIKMTLQKIFNYISWILLSTSISMAFGIPSLVFIIMAVIYGLEVLSLINKYGESKGIDIDEAAMLKLVFKFIWSRITGNFDETFNDVVRKHGDKKSKRPMNPQPPQ
jgi:hypothetical protein